MSMFSGLTNQISGWVANKTGQGQPEGEQVDPNMQQQQPMAQENGGEAEMVGEGGEQAAGGVSGLAQGLMMKAMAAKEGMKEKAGAINPGMVTGMGASLMSNVTNLIPGRKEEEVPTPPEPNPPSEMGGEVVYTEEQVYTE